MRRLFLVSFCLILALALTSCATQRPGVPVACVQPNATLTAACFDALYTRYAPLLQASTQIAVGQYLTQHPGRAQPMLATLRQIRETLAQTELSTLAQLEAVVRQQIAWDTLSSQARMGIEGMLTAVRVGLEALLTDLGVDAPAQIRLVVKDVVGWSHEATLVSCPSCVRQVGRSRR